MSQGTHRRYSPGRIGLVAATIVVAVVAVVALVAVRSAYRKQGILEDVHCRKNVMCLGFYLRNYLHDEELRRDKPIPKGADALSFVMAAQAVSQYLFCPKDPDTEASKVWGSTGTVSSYTTWDADNLIVTWDKVVFSGHPPHLSLPLIWERRGNHSGKHFMCDMGGTVQLLDAKSLEELMTRAKSLIAEAKSVRGD